MYTILDGALLVNGIRVCIHEDPAYMLRPSLQIAFNHSIATVGQTMYYKAMRSVRESVQWIDKEVKESWISQDFKRNLKVQQAPIGKNYIVSALLRNIKA